VLRGTKAVREALVGQAEVFAGRGRVPTFESTFRGHGLLFSDGERWRQLRRFTMMALRDFGMGRRSIESQIQEEAQELLQEFKKTQEKVFEEISRVVGLDRAPTIADRSQMPFTEATIHEIQRCSNLIPMAFPHRFLIPKGTDVYPLLSSALNDPTYFKNPQNFDPGNFLDEQGQFQRSEAFMPFSGSGLCLGEGLARTELFLFLTTILQTQTPNFPPKLQNWGRGKTPPKNDTHPQIPKMPPNLEK
uniref:Uncharacterized protein n=1 Tax=Malurus cyaneus samueli TaxID=2593467 RepID=A0A8C5U0F6_9PASS